MRRLRHDAGFVRRLTLALALVACRPDPGETWARALAAPSWEEARGACEELDAPAECLVAAMEQHGRLELADCDVVPPGLWNDECVFRYAERAAKAGQSVEAVTACNRTRFARECSFHLVRAAAEGVWEAPMETAASGATAWGGLQRAPDAPRLYWRSWFRKRQAGRLPVDPTGCVDQACLDGARETVFLALTGLAKAAGDDFCEGPRPTGEFGERRLWADNDRTARWVEEWSRSECARRARDPKP